MAIEKNLDLKKIKEFNSLNGKMKKFYETKNKIKEEFRAFNLSYKDKESIENNFLEICQLNKKRCQLYGKYWEGKHDKNILSHELNLIGEEIEKTQGEFYELSSYFVKNNFKTSL